MGVLGSIASSLLGALPFLSSMPRWELDARRCLYDLQSMSWRVRFRDTSSFVPCVVYRREIGHGGRGIDPNNLEGAKT